jgi:twin arginine-targeting protein translocase TatB
MLGLGWTEMLVIGVVALIVIGPKDLPVVMGRIGKVIGQVQRMGREFQREINKTTGLDEVRNLRNSITAPLQKTAEEIRKDFNAIGKDGKEQPSGVLKPADPSKESVVEAIQQQAGMAPAKKSNDELAASYGFKFTKDDPAKPATDAAKPVKAARAPADAAAKGKELKPAADAATSAAKTATKPKAAAKPRSTAAKQADTDVATGTLPATAARKATRKAASPKLAKPVAPDNAEPKPATKPRASRKKPADSAAKSE